MTWGIVVGWCLGWALLWRMPTLLAAATSTASDATVSVVVPMRNEVDRIPLLLASLERQVRRPDQVIVVDDGSDDGSRAAACAFADVRVVDAPEVPEGWTGKSWACRTGARSADGELLIFLDADVTLGQNAIGQLLRTWSTHGGLISVQPHHRIERPFEAISLLFNVVAVMGLGVGSLVPPRSQWGAAGPCLVTSRADYDRVGGHAAVAGEIAEDLALADAYRHTGRSVRCFGGADQLSFRMYRNGHDLVQGWTKNIATGARRTPLLRSLAIAAWMTALISLLVAAISAAGSPDWQTASTLYLAGAFQVGVLGSRVGRFGVAFALWPILVAAFLTIFASSTLQTVVLRRVRWSGRYIPLQRHG